MLSSMVMVTLMVVVVAMAIRMKGVDMHILIPMVVSVTTTHTAMIQVILLAVTLKS
jgi:hypothetical protein